MSQNIPYSAAADCDPDKKVTELMRKAVGNDYEYLFLLCEASSFEELFERDTKGRTALDWARQRNNPDAVDIISAAMSSALSKTRMQSTSVLENMMTITRNGNSHNQQQLWAALDERDADRVLKILLTNDVFRDNVAQLSECICVSVHCISPGRLDTIPLFLFTSQAMRYTLWTTALARETLL